MDMQHTDVDNSSRNGPGRRHPPLPAAFRVIVFGAQVITVAAFPAYFLWAAVYHDWRLTWEWVGLYFGIVVSTLVASGIVNPDEAIILIAAARGRAVSDK